MASGWGTHVKCACTISDHAIQLKQCTFLTFTLLCYSNWKMSYKETVFMKSHSTIKPLFKLFDWHWVLTMNIAIYTRSMTFQTHDILCLYQNYMSCHLQVKLQLQKKNEPKTNPNTIHNRSKAWNRHLWRNQSKVTCHAKNNTPAIYYRTKRDRNSNFLLV